MQRIKTLKKKGNPVVPQYFPYTDIEDNDSVGGASNSLLLPMSTPSANFNKSPYAIIMYAQRAHQRVCMVASFSKARSGEPA
jgi:hypothetical protein